MPSLTKNQLVEMAGACGVDPRTAVSLYARFLVGDLPPAARFMAELLRRGVEVPMTPGT